MDDYRKLAQEKYLQQKKIKIEADDICAKQAEEKLNKLKEEHTKCQVYIQSQMLIIDESIESFSVDKTDDNIMLILTIIKACIENIQDKISEDDKKILINQVLKFTSVVDNNNYTRPKGINTIANVNILKNGFEQIYSLLNLDVDIQTLDTDNDEKIARDLQQALNIPKDEGVGIVPRYGIIEDNMQNVYNVQNVHNDIGNDVGDEDHEDEDHEDHEFHEYNEDNEEEDDEIVARRLQEEINKPMNNKKIKTTKPVLSTRYQNLSCDDFLSTLLGEKI
jgi:hypothetical protein